MPGAINLNQESSVSSVISVSATMAPIVSALWAIAALLVSTAYPVYLWYPNTYVCIPTTESEPDACIFNPISVLLGAVIAVCAHSIFVALASYTPISAPLRRTQIASTSITQRSKTCFNAFLWMSIAFDVALWAYALSYVSNGEELLQALVISFNAPILVFAPYLFAAMSDPSSDIGSWLHYLKSEVDARLLERRAREIADASADEAVSLLASSGERRSPSSSSTYPDEKKCGWKMFAGV